MRIKTLLFLISFLLLNTSLFSSPFGWEDEDPDHYIILGTKFNIKNIYGFEYIGAIGDIEKNTRLGYGVHFGDTNFGNTKGKPFIFKINNAILFGYEFSFTPITYNLWQYDTSICNFYGKDYGEGCSDEYKKCDKRCKEFNENALNYWQKYKKTKDENKEEYLKKFNEIIEKAKKDCAFEETQKNILPPWSHIKEECWEENDYYVEIKGCNYDKNKYCKKFYFENLNGIQLYYQKSILSIFKQESYGVRFYLPYNFMLSFSRERWTDFHKEKNQDLNDYDYVTDRIRYLNVISISWPAILYKKVYSK